MKEVKAYMSFDGKLFMNADKCMAHEKEKLMYPMYVSKTKKINGNLGVEYVTLDFMESKTKRVKSLSKSYYRTTTGWEVTSTERVNVANIAENIIYGINCANLNNLTYYVLNLLTIKPNIEEKEFIRYIKNFYFKKVFIIQKTVKSYPYTVGDYDYKNDDSNSLELTDQYSLEDKDVMVTTKDGIIISIKDNHNHIHIDCFYKSGI